MISSDRSGSRLPVGSSARMITGSLTSARAIAMRCCSPPDSSIGNAFIRCCRPTHFSTWKVRRCCCVGAMPSTRGTNDDVLEHGLGRQQLEVLEHEAERAAVGLHLARRQRATDRGRRRSAARRSARPAAAAGAAAWTCPRRSGRSGRRTPPCRCAATGRAAHTRRGCTSSRRCCASITRAPCRQHAARRRVVDARRDPPCRAVDLHDLADEKPERLGLAGAVLARPAPACAASTSRTTPSIAAASSIRASPSASTMSPARGGPSRTSSRTRPWRSGR